MPQYSSLWEIGDTLQLIGLVILANVVIWSVVLLFHRRRQP